MKLFSTKNRQRALSLILSGLACVATASGVALLDGIIVGSADVQTDIANATVKIEDLIETTADFNVIEARGSGWKSGADTAFNWNGGTVMWGHNKNDMAVRTSSVAGDGSVVDYDGNLAVWTDDQTSTHKDGTWTGVGFQIAKATPYAQTLGQEGYGVINFRTRYDAQWNKAALNIMASPKYGSVFNDNNGRGGYSFHISGGKISFNEDRTTGNIPVAINASGLGFSETPADNDIWDVTYGVLKNGETNVIYLKIDKWNETSSSWTTITDFTYTDDNLADNEYNVAGKAFSLIFCGPTTKANNNNCGVLLAGVDEPINAKGAWTETVTAGKKLSEITLSRNGYTAVNADESVAVGTKDYAVGKTVDYYGKSVNTTAYVTLTGEIIVTADQFAGATTNIENIIDSTADFNVVTASNKDNSHVANTLDWNGEGNILNNVMVYAENKGAAQSTYLDYDGNLALWMNETESTGTSWWCGVGYQFMAKTTYAQNAGEGYGLIRFRMNYDIELGPISLNMMSRRGVGYLVHDQGKAGYAFNLMENGTIKFTESTQSGDLVVRTAPTYTATAPKDNDVLDITYGVYKYSDSINVLYLNIDRYNGTAWDNICKYTYVDADLSDNNFGAAGQNGAFSIVSCVNLKKDTPKMPGLLLAGVNEPILADVAAEAKKLSGYDVDESEGYATLGDIQLPENYAWKNSNTALELGTTEYDATYSYAYYGVQNVMDVKVPVTLTGVRTTVELKDGENVLYTETLKSGESFAFNTATLTGVDTVIGWTAEGNNDLLNPNYTFTATESGTFVFNVVDMNFKLLDGASIRTTVDEKGNGGIRFVAMFDSSDWADLAKYITGAYGMIVPADDATYFNNGFTAEARALYQKAENNFVGKTALSYADFYLTEEQAGGYAMYSFALTNIKYKNYNRAFAGAAFITVTYADGSTQTFETAYDAEKNCRSVYEVAIAALSAHAAAENGLYSNKQLAVLEGYVSNVVDVEYNATENTFAVVDREGHGIARPYTVVSGEKAEGNVVTLVLTASETSLLAVNNQAPVYITIGQVTTRYVASVSYANGQATLTLTMA